MLEDFGSVVFGLIIGWLIFSITWIGHEKEQCLAANRGKLGVMGMVSFALGSVSFLIALILLFSLEFFPTIGN